VDYRTYKSAWDQAVQNPSFPLRVVNRNHEMIADFLVFAAGKYEQLNRNMKKYVSIWRNHNYNISGIYKSYGTGFFADSDAMLSYSKILRRRLAGQGKLAPKLIEYQKKGIASLEKAAQEVDATERAVLAGKATLEQLVNLLSPNSGGTPTSGTGAPKSDTGAPNNGAGTPNSDAEAPNSDAGTPDIGVGTASIGVGAASAFIDIDDFIEIRHAKIPRRPDQDVTTGLGSDADRLINLSPSLQADCRQLLEDGWSFEYGPEGGGSYADRTRKVIVLDGNLRGNPQGIVQMLSHEVGHATYAYEHDFSSKKAFLNGTLADEGAAVMDNIKVQREILANGGPDIGLPGNRENHQAYNKAYDQYLANGDAQTARNTIGTIMAHGEITSTTGQTYYDYYGGWYDANFV
jgi:hypothetical protein